MCRNESPEPTAAALCVFNNWQKFTAHWVRRRVVSGASGSARSLCLERAHLPSA